MAEALNPVDKGGGGVVVNDHGAGGGQDGSSLGGNKDMKRMSYSDRLKTNVRMDHRLKRNILEITLEKTKREAGFDIGQEDFARVFKTLGIDMVAQVQGHQVQHKGRVSTISVWMAPGVSLDRFCKDMSIRVNEGVMTGMIRPAGKKDVTVTIIGLDFNTPDMFVFDYLSKFGTVLEKTVIYSKYPEGPCKGKFNGERKFQVDFSKANVQMGTFHIIDGCKVRVYYRGNTKTCGRCHKGANQCPGSGYARDCEAGHGQRVFLSEHMKTLWNEVGFVPTTFELEEEERPVDDVHQAALDAPVIRDKQFSPKIKRPEPTSVEIEKFDGIAIKNIPKTVEDKDIFDFLFHYGLPEEHGIENIRINRGEKNTWVVVDGLETEDVQTLNKCIHFPVSRQKYFDVPIYCRPLRNMTPLKGTKETSDDHKEDNENPKSPSKKEPTKPTESKKSDIPGLAKSEKIKADKKAKEKKKANEKKEAEGRKKSEETLVRKNFMKSNVFEDEPETDEGFDFEDETPTTTKPGSKFFTRTPIDDNLPPGISGSSSERRSAKEETWKSQIQQHQSLQVKRVCSPDQDQVRNLRLKQ